MLFFYSFLPTLFATSSPVSSLVALFPHQPYSFPMKAFTNYQQHCLIAAHALSTYGQAKVRSICTRRQA